VNRGFVIAYVHTRGRGELGRVWYRASPCRLSQIVRAAMEQQIAQAEEKVKQGIAHVEETGAKLERTADACSFLS
jgi:protease II